MTFPTCSIRLALVAAITASTLSAMLYAPRALAASTGDAIFAIGEGDLRGTGTPRIDKRLFFVAEPLAGGALVQSLTNVQTIKVTEPLLEEPAEYLVGTIDLSNNTPALVTSIIGYDANTYVIYTRKGISWAKIYGGGGAAM